ncbi:LrgB family protein [Pararhizobium sp. IMCC21322]|uniref:LrgB family protein n=1 Tax=Pararhizobium sp. IMCC21322 TaxID=3067903 RepID=UPI0027415D82|nr:LrgB family protein [Pararhizobium sp. IMCC21322]
MEEIDNSSLFEVWVYLSQTPLLWLTTTLVAYIVADSISKKLDRHPLANPVIIAAGVLIIILEISGTTFQTYFEGAQFVHFLLGPATVALAVPLFKNLPKVTSRLVPVLAALIGGSITAILSALAIGWALNLPSDILVSLAPKSVTTPIAMGISEQLGGIPTLTAVLVIATGITGAVMVTPLMNVLKIQDYAARGFAVGIASHGIGTARAFQINPLAGTFAGIAMALNGALTALLVPLLVKLF